jgi:hypothetical protein
LNDPINGVDSSGTTVINLSGKPLSSALQADPYYQSANKNPNITVYISNGMNSAIDQGAVATTTGNSTTQYITLSPNLQNDANIIGEVLGHEFVHVDQLASGNFSYTDPSRRDPGAAEGEAYQHSDPYGAGTKCH